LRTALANAEQNSSRQLQSDAQSTAALRSELELVTSQLQIETAVCLASRQGRDKDASESATQLKRMGLSLRQRFEERERELLFELSAQKDALRRLQ